MKATPVLKTKERYGGGTVEIVIWRVPQPVPPSEHPYKYRLVYVVGGRRVVGYDNERGKGDHRHRGEQEEAYHFVDPDTLMADFWCDVKGAAT
ncbi:toxin-antitoxin system TumE family protein [Thauera aromatica]|uniref:toxin-antitoxin system TumE family protein n=1 Tax=Thauera aromatica TaxID=59405 RepID=UPI001FFC8FC3|nr:DUF6516 family protein [Thauera aromatica]MCK2095201.1 DUF6516 family protein [Thauera aromatica]